MERVQIKATEVTKESELFSLEKGLWKSFGLSARRESLGRSHQCVSDREEEDRGRLSSIILRVRIRRIGHKWNRKFSFICAKWEWNRNHCFTVWVVQRRFGFLGIFIATHSSWPCLSRGWTKGSQESHSHLNNSMKIQLDCVTLELEWGQLYLSINWNKVSRFSSKQSNHSGFVNICNSRSPHSLQSSASCSLCGS